MELSRERPLDGLLYPMMVFAAVAVIAFSVLGIASISGWLPSSLASTAPTELDTARSGVTFECAECGVIESIREFEKANAQVNAVAPRLVLLDS